MKKLSLPNQKTNNKFDAKHWIALSLIGGIGYQTIRRLLQVFESPGDVLSATHDQLSKVVPSKIVYKIINRDNKLLLDKTLNWLQSENCHLITFADDLYPSLLLETSSPPPLLYARGNIDLLNVPLIAVVGSRNASAPGVQNTKIFTRALSDAGLGIVSGLAQGIDAAAHRGGLSGKTGTIAVIGTGIDITYPKINRSLALEIAQNGLLLSEFPLETKPFPENFPRRNRIISGLSQACLIMEATLKSGSLITAKLAAEQGREVFSIPGSINSPMYRGCHRLIKDGAKLVENVHDILDELNLESSLTVERYDEEIMDDNSDLLIESVLIHINYEPTSVDDIAGKAGVSIHQLMPNLLELEMSGKIVPVPGGRYQRI